MILTIKFPTLNQTTMSTHRLEEYLKPRENNAICAYGATALQQQVQYLKQDWKGVHSASEDIEYVHRMRVATRRFRSIFDIFARCLPRKKRERWEKEIVRLTKALGDARDLDVHIALLSDFSQTLPEPQYHPGIIRLLLRLKQQRQQLQPQIVNDLDRMMKKNVLEEMEHSLKKIIPVQTDAPSPFDTRLYQMAFKSINRCMNNLLLFDGRIQNPKNIKDLHDMRLEAKNLRYTIEIFQDLYTDRLETQLAVAQDMQSQLGVIHDEDNWIANLDQFLEEERKRVCEFYGNEGPFNLLKPGIAYLRKARQKNRNQQYRSFIRKWEKWKTDNLWGSLYQITKLPTIIYLPKPDAVQEPETVDETLPALSEGTPLEPDQTTETQETP